jgi:hypothetical protein
MEALKLNVKRLSATFVVALFILGSFLDLPSMAQGTTSYTYTAPVAPPAASGAPAPAAVLNSTPAAPLRPPIQSTPSPYSSYSSSYSSSSTTAPGPIGALPPNSSTGGSGDGWPAWTYNTPPPLPPVAPTPIAAMPPAASSTGSTSNGTTKHHKGLAEDGADAVVYVGKCYVFTYIVLPTKIVKGTINALF